MLFETFHSLQETLVDFARTHADWLAPLGFAFAFLKSLPLVALVIPGTALLLSIGAILGLGDTGFVPVWLATVSYTHLDVYKRQGRASRRRRSGRPAGAGF